MNKHLHRIIFNANRGQLMVVSEAASASGKSAGGERMGASSAGGAGGAMSRAPGVALHPLKLATMAMLSLLIWTAPMLPAAHAQIIANPNAPGNQRPTILQTANGVAQVNIQTPSAAGVSRNLYIQFDVQQKGAILNNSRTTVQTQLGGFQQGNPWLATGPARVILNEISSSNSSQLMGPIEVGGQRAEVVIANPAGINVDGAGFINASRVTLTTGTPVMSGASLDAYRVQGGVISINGQGLDTRDADYTGILARGVQVNAGVWARELRVVTGANQIDAAQGAATPLPGTGTGAAPSFALDVAQLGGMYAGKIFLVGTEAGLGARNAGVIGATAGNVVLQSNGWLSNSGSIQATGNAHIDTHGSASNSGIVYAYGDTHLVAGGSITNTGMLAAQGNTSVQATGVGAWYSGSKGSVIAAGINPDGTINNSGDLIVSSTATVTLNGQTIAGGNAVVSGARLDLSFGKLAAQNLTLSALVGELNANRAEISAHGVLAIGAAQTARTDGATVAAYQLSLNARDLSNVAGEIVQTGNADLKIQLSSPTSTLDNTLGRIAVRSRNFSLGAHTLINTDGEIEHAGIGALALDVVALNDRGGKIAGNGTLVINAQSIDHQNANTVAQQITVVAGNLNNHQGDIAQVGSGQTTLRLSGAFNNSAGTLASNGITSVRAHRLDNTQGRITSALGADFTLAADLNNTDGSIATGQNLSLASASIDNTRGVLQASTGNAILNVDTFLNAGSVYAGGSLDTRAVNVSNSGSLYAAGSQTLRASGAVSNTGVIAAHGNMTIVATDVNSTSTSLLGAGIASDGSLGNLGDLRVRTAQTLTAQGQNLATGNASFSGAFLDLSTSQTSASTIELTATAGNVNTSAATLTAQGTLHVTAKAESAQTLDNRGGTLSAGQLHLDVANLDNARGQIVQTGTGNTTIALSSPGGRLNNTAGRIAVNSQNLSLGAATLDNVDGRIEHAGTATLAIDVNLMNGQRGQITSNGALIANTGAFIHDNASTVAKQISLSATRLSNRSGEIIQTGSGLTTLTALGAMDNSAGTITSNGTTRVNGQTLSNQGGTIQATGAASLNLVVNAGLDNSGAGKLAAGGDFDLVAGALNNRQGSITAGGGLGAALTQGLDNTQGLIAANGDVSLAAASLDNTRARVASVQGSATLSSLGATQNDSGIIQSALDLTLVNGGLSNAMATGATQAGRITAGRNASIQTRDQALNNTQGTIAAGQVASLKTGALNNDSGLIQAGTALNINTSGRALSNTNASQHVTGAGGITSQGTMALATGDINNAQGFVGAKGALTATAANISNTAGGQIVGQSSVSMSSTGFDNRGGQVQTLGSLGIDAGAGTINNAGSLMRSAEDLSLSAATVINSNALGADQGIEAHNVAIAASTVNNYQGAIRADSNTTVTSSGVVNNSQGLISAGRLLDLRDSAATRSLAVTNTGGTFISGQNTMLRAASLSGDGRVLGQQDISLDLTTHFVQNVGAQITANRHVSVTTTGDFTNSGKLQAGGTLIVNANHVDNTATGDISGAVTRITATQTLTNRGVIDGTDTQINADTLNNLGTGRIYGDHLSISANTINNEAQNGTAATLAARTRLDIGVQTLNNREHALIFSGGDMAIGGLLDANRLATGQAGRVNNASATIEALGNMAINASALRNSNEHFTTQIQQVSGPVSAFYIQPQGSPVKTAGSNFVWESWSRAGQYRYVTTPAAGSQTILGSTAIARVGEQNCTGSEPNETCTRTPGADYLTADPVWPYFALVPPATEPLKPALTPPVAPDPAGANSCEAGVSHNANACTAYNKELTTFNSDKTAFDTAWAAYDSGHAVWTADTDIKYGQLDAAIETYNDSFAGSRIRKWTQYSVTRTESQSHVITSDPGKILSGGAMSLRGAELVNDKSQIIAGAILSGDLANLRNVQAQGQHVVHEEGTSQYTYDRWRGGFKRYHQRDWDPVQAYAPADEVTTFELPVSVQLDNTAHARLAPAIDVASTANTRETAARSGVVSALVKTAALGTSGVTINALANAAGHAAATVVGGGAVDSGHAPVITQATLVNPTGGAQTVRAVPVNSALPNTSLYQIHPAASAGHLIEIDPRFANYRQWLGSDYLLQAMGYDPVTVQKRLGDGFYEQKLIREQVAQLTGQRFLGDFRSDEAQYKALMDAGMTFAHSYNLRPGIALSAAQMAQLTSDMVWLVEQTVTLGDGTRQQVLVPQLYVRVKEGDLGDAGALLAGKEVNLQLTGDLSNSGTIAGRTVVKLTAQNIENLGGRIRGADVTAAAIRDLNNIGGTISADSQLVASAGRDLHLLSTTQSNAKAAGLSSFARTNMDRVAGLYVTGAQGVLVASAGRDVSIIAGVISNSGKDGATALAAGRNLTLGAVQTTVQANTVRDSANYLRQGSSQDVGSRVQTTGNLRLQAGQDITANAAEVSAGAALTATAGRSVLISAGENSNNFSEGRSHTNSGAFSSKSTTTRTSVQETRAIGTSIGGNTVSIASGNDINVKGSSVISDSATTLVAGNNVSIEAATNTRSESSFRAGTKSGLGAMGGLSFGQQQQSTNQQTKSSTAAASTVGAVAGNVNIVAGNQYKQTGSDVTAPGGDVSIVAKKVDIIEARETSQSSTEQKFKQSGVSVTLSNPLIDAALGVKGTAATLQAVGNTSNARMQALGTAAAALNAYNTASQVGQVLADPVKAATSVGINFALGSSQSQSRSAQTSDTARGSTVAAGGNVSITAGGAGKDSDILIRGSDITAVNNARLKAEGAVNLQAAQNTVEQHNTNTGSSASIGFGVNFGSQSGISLNASASKSRGNADGQDVVQSNTHVTAGNTVSLTSGGDTTLKGAVVAARTVKADVGGDLKIQSLQDTSTYASQQSSVGVGVSLCLPPICYGTSTVSASVRKSNIDGNFASVTEQSGLKAGDGGFQVTVKNDTDLQGGAITSTGKAVNEGKNSFTTGGALTTGDIQNRADYKGDGYSISASLGFKAGDQRSASTPEQVAAAGAKPVNSASAGVGSDKGSAASTTQAGISGIAGNTQARTDDAQTGIDKILDAGKVQREIDAQVQITAEFGKQAIPVAAKFADDKALDLRRQGNEEEALKWDEKGAYRTAIYGGLGLLTGGASGATGAIASALVVPTIGEEIASLNLPEPVRQGLTQLMGLAVGLAAGGSAGGATALPQTALNYVSHSPFANVRRTVSQENARLMNQCSASCTLTDLRNIDMQISKLEAAGNLSEISKNSRLTTEQAIQLGETVASLLPFYGTPIALYQAISGQSLTGKDLSTAERFFNGVAAAVPLGSTAYKLVLDAAQNMSKMASSIGAVQRFKSAVELNGLMNTFNKAPAWKEGTQIAEATLQPGTRVQMVVDKAAFDKLTQEGQMNFVGNWASFDNIPNQAFARNNLAITNEFKKDVGYVVELEIVKPVNAQIGVVGPQGAAAGGANQMNFLFDSRNGGEFFKVVGQRKLP